MSNLKECLKTLLMRAHRAGGGDDGCLYEACGVSIMFGDFAGLDPKVPIHVDTKGHAKLPPRSRWAVFVPDTPQGERDRILGMSYIVHRGAIKHLRLDELSGDDEFWWLMMITAINVETGK